MTLPYIELTGDGLAARGASPELLKDLLLDYESRLLTAGIDLRSCLAPGLSRVEIEDQFASIDLVPPEELVVLYQWRNGPSGRGPLVPIPQFEFWSLPKAIHHRIALSALVADAQADPVYARFLTWGTEAGWLRVTHDNWGYSVDCNRSPQAAPRVRRTNPEFFEDESSLLGQCVSLCTLVTWWIESFDAGAYYFDQASNEWLTDATKLSPEFLASAMI